MIKRYYRFMQLKRSQPSHSSEVPKDRENLFSFTEDDINS